MEGCSKYCSFCVVPYTRGEEVSRPVRGRAGRSRATRRAGRARGQPARPERQRLSRAVRRRRDRRPGLLIRAIAQIEGIGRIRFTTSHPLEFSDSLIEAYRDVPQLANYLHLPVQSGTDRMLCGDEARLHRARVQAEDPQAARGAPGHLDLLGFHRRLPRRDRCRLREDDEADRGRRLRPVVLLHLFAPPGHAGRRPRRRHARQRTSTRAWSACRRTSMRTAATISQAMVGSVQTRAGRRPARARIRTNSPARPRTCAR